MAGERKYTRIPPESTGDRVRMVHTAELRYDGKDTSHSWVIGDHYYLTGASNSNNDFSIHVHGVEEETSTTGVLSVHYQKLARHNGYTPEDDQSIRKDSNSGDIVATINGLPEDLYIPGYNIVGYDNPEYGMNVDATGSASIRFDEGRPQLDGFGRLRVSSGTTLGDYVFAYDALPNDFSTKLVGNATVGHDEDRHCLVLTCPSGAPGATFEDTTNVDTVAHTTNTYHHYFPGFSHTAIMTVALANTSVTGCTRNWGYFDSKNGYMFRNDDDSGKLKLVVRSNASGSVVETVIEATDFNGDKVDGTGESQMNLRLQDDNIYWIDVQWLGAGRVRFGTYHRGQRVVIHEHYHEGDTLNAGKPSAQTGSLPICYAMTNTVNQTSDVKILAWCAAVHTEHEVDINTIGRPRLDTITKTFNPTSLENGQNYELIGSFSPVKTIKAGSGGSANRSLYLPNYLEAFAYHADGTEAWVEVEVYLDPIIGGGKSSFPINSDEVNESPAYGPWLVPVDTLVQNAVEVYKPADFTLADRPKFWGGGVHLSATYMKGQRRVDLNGTYNNTQTGSFRNYAENGGTQDHPVGAWTVSPDGSTATSYTAGGSQLRHREGYPVAFYGVAGTASSVLNFDENGGTRFYIKVTGINTAELYEDDEFTVPVITNGLTVTANGRMRAYYGDQMYFVAVAKPLAPSIAKYNASPSAGDITVHFNLGWSEIIQ